jgi:hypothetical protein
MRFERFPIVVVGLLILCLATVPMFGQSLTTGNISGTLLDPTNAVVPGASINLKGVETGSTANTVTNSTGGYSFNLLKPGRYQITVKQAGFAELSETAEVEVGQSSRADLHLVVTKTAETVEVSGTAPLVNTEASMNTAFTQQEVAQLPSAGGDITNIAQTAPGVVVNGTGGYGNFTANGLPATSNLFTVNGENDMDPYFNINNSGASNLTMGQNEIGEATVITNPYSGNYGQLAGAQITYVTKSGTNTFHGNAMYWWNGRLLNANDWMNVESQASSGQKNQPAFSNANQWATSFGGPIIKDKTFFFVDYEGLRFVLPNVFAVTTPTPAFAAAAMKQVAISHPAESTTFNQLMGLYTNAPGYGTQVAYAPSAGDSCSTLAFDASITWAAGTPCSGAYTATPTALAWEYILSFRVDQKLGNNDNMFARYKLDHGLQPTLLDPLNPKLDYNSLQPSWDSQVQETHVFGPTKTNQFTASLSHYVAQFTSTTAAGVFNYAEAFSEDSGIYNFTSPNRDAYAFPQGRNITQYQFIDDFSWTRGNHTFKFGENFRRYDVSDHNFFFNSPLVYWGYSTSGLQSFAQGEAYQYRKADNLSTNVPVAMWGIGIYGQDEWKVSSRLKLTLALRVERNSNPVCQISCFANLKGPFAGTAAVAAGTSGSQDVPYSSDISYNQKSAYPGVDKVVLSPRFGFSWDPRGTSKTVISGGFGLFYDNPAAGLVDNLLGNPPVSVALRVRGKPLSKGVLPFDPAGAPATWQASANAFKITDSFNQIQASLPAGVQFRSPAVGAIVGTIKAPEWQEWNLSVQQELNHSTVLLVNYVGNHGVRISYSDPWPNAFDGTGGSFAGGAGYFGGGVPLSPAANSYAAVTEFKSGAVSSYQGLTVSLRKQFTKWIAAHVNYTWSHNIDETSNGGLFNSGFEGNNSILGQISPVSLRAENYGNTDYDIRHLLNGDFVFNPEFHQTGALKWLVNGWQFSGKAFWRTGLPESIVDGFLNGSVINGGDTVFANLGGNGQVQVGTCGKSNANFAGLATQCLNPAGVLDTAQLLGPMGGYPTQTRNQFRGPHYFDMDLNLFKNFKLMERFNFAIGAQAFNAFNHPNFGLPNTTFYGGDPTFGTINSMQGTPTSPYGNFLGFDSSPRVMQLTAKLVF